MNPVLWFAFARIRADRELACDAMALALTNAEENEGYGRTILKLLRQFSTPSMFPATVGLLESKTNIKARITMIARFDKKSHR